MSLLLVSLALAGPRTDLGAALVGRPDVAVVCTDLRSALPLERVADALAADRGADPDRTRDELSGWLGRVFADGSGLDFRLWRESRAFEMRFHTDLDEESLARAFAEGLDGRTAPVVPQARGWQVQLGDGRDLHVEVTDRRARAVVGTPRSAPGLGDPRLDLGGLPDSDGCAAWTRLLDDEGDTTELAAHFVPGGDVNLHFALTGSWAKAVEGVAFDPQPPPEVRTPTDPEAVLVLGIGLDSINFSRFLAGKELRGARWLQAKLPVTAGTTVAVVPQEDGPGFGAAVPLARPIPARTVDRRLRAAMRRLDLPVLRVDDRRFVATADDSVFWVAAADGRFLVASDPALLETMQGDDGGVWVDERARDLAGRYALVLLASALPGGLSGLRLDTPASLAVTIDGKVLHGELAAPIPFAALVEMLSRLPALGMAAPGFGPERAP